MDMIFKTVAASDGFDFVLSDATVDSYGDSIDPNGWDLSRFKTNPVALWDHGHDPEIGRLPLGLWENVRVVGKQLIGTLDPFRGTHPKLDGIIRLIENKVLRATSVGFQPKKQEPIDKNKPYGGQRYLEQLLLETSIVAIPANPATLALAKSLNLSTDELVMAFGEHATKRRDLTATGENADTTSADLTRSRADRQTQVKAPKMKTISQRVEEARAAFDVARDAYNDHVGVDDYDIDQATALKGEMDSRKERLDSLAEAEKALGTAAQDAAVVNKAAPAVIRRPLGSPAMEVKASDLFVRAGVINLLAHLSGKSIDQVLDERYPGHEATAIVSKAAIAVATTTTSGWASQLVETATAEFLALLPPTAIYPVLREMGVSLTFGPNSGNIKIPFSSSTTALAGGFVLEGDPIPVGRMTLDSVTLTPTKFGIIVPMTKEVMRYTNPTLESVVRSELLARTAITLDGLLIDSTASSATRPAGLLNGLSVAGSAYGGGDYQAFLADIKTLLAPFDTANAGRKLAILMNPQQARNIRMLAGPNSSGFGWANQFLADYRVVVSTVVPAGEIIAVDTADFVTSTGDTPEFETSDQATIHMDSSPSPISATGSPNTVAAPIRSMFQTNSVALKMTLNVNWAMRRTGMVQYMTGITW